MVASGASQGSATSLATPIPGQGLKLGEHRPKTARLTSPASKEPEAGSPLILTPVHTQPGLLPEIPLEHRVVKRRGRQAERIRVGTHHTMTARISQEQNMNSVRAEPVGRAPARHCRQYFADRKDGGRSARRLRLEFRPRSWPAEGHTLRLATALARRLRDQHGHRHLAIADLSLQSGIKVLARCNAINFIRGPRSSHRRGSSTRSESHAENRARSHSLPQSSV